MSLRSCSRQILQTLAFLSCGVLGSTRSSCSARRAMKKRRKESPPLLEKPNEKSEETRRMSRRPTLLNALDHANRAVALDTAGSVSEATEEYTRTIELLEGVLRGIGQDTSDNEDSVRIKKIVKHFNRRQASRLNLPSVDTNTWPTGQSIASQLQRDSQSIYTHVDTAEQPRQEHQFHARTCIMDTRFSSFW
ncbi:hypothetical protein FRC11_008000 [Ceratobasidium sp. 423]|nr:hypothetical protein FRC11_008000 [Ceratobasidium sp. 423]